MLVGITGGSGFIGKTLVEKHIANGDDVRILTRYASTKFKHNRINLYYGDLTGSVDKLASFVENVDVLYHCAGETRDENKMYETHLTGTKNLCEAAKNRIGHWVQLSSVGVYGSQSDGLITEETHGNPIGIYETSKAKSDQIVIDYALKKAFQCTILRPSNIYGPTMKNQSLFQLIKMVDRGLFFYIGSTGASANYIHVDNVVEALTMCGRKSTFDVGIYNLSDYLPIESFIDVIADELGRPKPSVRISERFLRLCAPLFDLIPGFPLTTSRINAMTLRTVYSIQKIQNSLGYSHLVSMEKGIRDLVTSWKMSKN